MNKFLALGVSIFVAVVIANAMGTKESSQPATADPRADAVRQQAAAQDAAEAAREGVLCPIELSCQRYAQVRQECATAGDFANCVNVKMGKFSYAVPMCASDGSTPGFKTDLKDQATCLFWKVQHWDEAP